MTAPLPLAAPPAQRRTLPNDSLSPPGVREVAIARLERWVGRSDACIGSVARTRFLARVFHARLGGVRLVHAQSRSMTSVECGCGTPFSSKTIVPPPESVPDAPR